MQLVSSISPPTKVHASAAYTSKVHVYIKTQLQKHSTQNSWYRIESTVRGHHVYKASWSPYIGEELPVQREVKNIHDDFAVAVLKNSSTVGHVPREISRVCWYFLHKSGSEMTCSHKLTKDSPWSTVLLFLRAATAKSSWMLLTEARVELVALLRCRETTKLCKHDVHEQYTRSCINCFV